MVYTKKEMEKMADALLMGGMTLQATPMLRPEGRTPAALARTASGFVGLSVVGATQKMAFNLLKPKKQKRRK